MDKGQWGRRVCGKDKGSFVMTHERGQVRGGGRGHDS